jgi:hypothetical protein
LARTQGRRVREFVRRGTRPWLDVSHDCRRELRHLGDGWTVPRTASGCQDGRRHQPHLKGTVHGQVYPEAPLDPPSFDWLGHRSDRVCVRNSGLWNQKRVTSWQESRGARQAWSRSRGGLLEWAVQHSDGRQQPQPIMKAAATTKCQSSIFHGKADLLHSPLRTDRGAKRSESDSERPFTTVVVRLQATHCRHPKALGLWSSRERVPRAPQHVTCMRAVFFFCLDLL